LMPSRARSGRCWRPIRDAGERDRRADRLGPGHDAVQASGAPTVPTVGRGVSTMLTMSFIPRKWRPSGLR
jgi:hypothetical protein